MGAIGSVWKIGSWADDKWATGSWADYVPPTGSWIDGTYVCEHLDKNVIWLKKLSAVAVETIRIATNNTTLTTSDQVLVCDKVTALTVLLPAATGTGKMFRVKNINTGVVTLDGSGAETIDGETTQAINRWDSISVVDYVSGKWAIT